VLILGCILSFHTSPGPEKNKMLYADTATVKPRNADTTASTQELTPAVVELTIVISENNEGSCLGQEAIRTKWFSGDAPYALHSHPAKSPDYAPPHPESGQYAADLLHPHSA
jgi:hypothetical protein